MQETTINPLNQKPLFDPTYLNIEYVFNQILEFLKQFLAFLLNPKFWLILGIISSLLSILFIALIVYSLVRMYEIQKHEKEEIEHEIYLALLRNQEHEQKTNPRWHYILTLIESPNESDWRVGIIEGDSMLEEQLRAKGFQGETVNDLLKDAKEGGLLSVQNAWDAHLIRNKIAHEGSDFSISQVEARRVTRLFQSVFEELGMSL